MDLVQKQEQRIVTAIKSWAERNGLLLNPQSFSELRDLVGTQIDIHRSEALSLVHEHLPGRNVFATQAFKEHQERGNTVANFIRNQQQGGAHE